MKDKIIKEMAEAIRTCPNVPEVFAAHEYLRGSEILAERIYTILEPYLEKEWLPIELAPKDGSQIDVWGKSKYSYDEDKIGQRIANVHWCSILNASTGEEAEASGWVYDNDSIGQSYMPNYISIEPTHFQHLPTPPTNKIINEGDE